MVAKMYPIQLEEEDKEILIPFFKKQGIKYSEVMRQLSSFIAQEIREGRTITEIDMDLTKW